MNIAAEGLYDLHNHLLFGVDDGAEKLEDTEAMLQDAVKNNIKVIAATPHMLPRTDMQKYEANFPEAAALAEKYGIKLLRGGEYNARSFPPEPPYIALGGGEQGAVLMDFRLPSFPPEFQLCVDNIFNAGYSLIIAHPERTFPESMLPDLERLFDSGVVYQVTAGSVVGKFGREPQRMAFKLLEKGWAKLVASDAHDDSKRPSLLLEAYNVIEKRYGAEAAAILQNNARNVIEEPSAPLQPIPVKRHGGGLFNWLFKRG
ncbi:MAG: hypothetical protein E7052_01895 [Lentisphaerae bacterium]|nr:hypothetical protein [Lentisphaerota bacterium]